MRLLLVTDDRGGCPPLKASLTQAGFVVDVADNSVDARDMGDMGIHDAVILDRTLLGQSGLDIVRHWRRRGNSIPVILLTTRADWTQRVEGLQSGVDYCVEQPWHTEELVACLQTAIRLRTSPSGRPLSAAGLTLDEAQQAVRTADGRYVELTGMEFRLLRYFMVHPGQVLSQARLIEHVYEDMGLRGSNVIETYVRRLRQKCGLQIIRTRRGQGYVFDASRGGLSFPHHTDGGRLGTPG